MSDVNEGIEFLSKHLTNSASVSIIHLKFAHDVYHFVKCPQDKVSLIFDTATLNEMFCSHCEEVYFSSDDFCYHKDIRTSSLASFTQL